ncbi:MAG: zeta toxin family protein [Plesiomonas shigelloides]
MSMFYARPLNEQRLVYKFLKDCIKYNDSDVNIGDVVLSILKQEMIIDNVPQHFSTLFDEKFRHIEYSDENARQNLRKIIFEELLLKERLTDDNQISLGHGGAKPKNLKKDSEAVIITGLPASGKSSIATKIADEMGAYIIDPDYAKLKFPEYKHFGANTVHKESTAIVRGGKKTAKEKNLLQACIYYRANVVIPTIGQDLDDVREERDVLIEKGYKVHLVTVSVSREEATRRALNRFIRTDRYVPLGLIFDGYANDPILTYHRVKLDSEWASFGKVNTEGSHPKVVEGGDNSPVKYFQEAE